MPDASSHRTFRGGPPPSGWSEAFAALPPEAPPAGGWERVARAFSGRALPERRRHRWPAWVAIAAVLALVAIVPLRWSRPDAPAATTPFARAPATTAEPARAATTQAVPTATRPAPVDGGADSPSNLAADASRDAAGVASVASEPAGAPTVPVQPATATHPDDASTGAPQVAAVQAPRQGANEPPAAPSELERLYAESAQLEGLLALARDGGGEVANGAVAMLSDDLAMRVARIDAALMQPSLAGERRVALWRERVDALRQAAAFESTQRLLAARGEQYDAMLVSID